AEQLAQRAVEIVDRELTDDAQLRVETRYHIAAALAEKDGQERAAIAQYTAAMDEARRLGLEGSLIWLYILNDRAMTHMEVGESAEALMLMSDAVAGLHTLMGDEVLPSWGVGYNNLAFAQFLEGDLEGAAASYDRALLGCETFPEQNALTASSVLNNYANVRAMQGDLDAAIAMHDRALVISRPLLERGGGEEDFGLSASGLAVQQCRMGNPDLGRSALGEVETHLAGSLGDPITWIYYYARSACALAAGDTPAAVEAARQAIEVGARARRTVDAVSRQQAALARAMIADGRADEASTSAQSAVAAYVQWLGDDHPVTRRVRAELSAALGSGAP
ncbi:MAG: tetratricopeptide repeat protein, partial [Pseudomonadota bacterium]